MGYRQYFNFEGLTIKDATQLFAYNGYRGITVKEHYQKRHDIDLEFENLPCVIQYYGPDNSQMKFFPIELLEIIDKNYKKDKNKYRNRKEDYLYCLSLYC